MKTTILSDIWDARLFPPSTAAVVHSDWALHPEMKTRDQLERELKEIDDSDLPWLYDGQ